MEVVDSRLTQKKFLSLVTYISVMKISFFIEKHIFQNTILITKDQVFLKVM